MGRIALAQPPGGSGMRVCGAYVLDRFVRDGLLASVYLARADGDTDARFVARVIHADLAPLAAQVEDLRREFHALRNVQMPGVAPLVASDAASTRPVWVTARVDGITLRERLASQDRMAPAEVATMVTALAAVLDALHARHPPVIHRAIQPENVLLGRAGGVFLEECGLAHALAAAGLLPDDVRQWLTPRTDVVMLATLAFRCLTGTAPFEGDASARPTAVPAPGIPGPLASDTRTSLPSAADAVLLRAWNGDPSVTYSTAGALAADLAHALVRPMPPSPSPLEVTDDVDRAFDLLLGSEPDDATPARPDARVPLESQRVRRVRTTAPPPLPSMPPATRVTRPPTLPGPRPVRAITAQTQTAPGPTVTVQPPPLPRAASHPSELDRPTVPMPDPLIALAALEALEARHAVRPAAPLPSSIPSPSPTAHMASVAPTLSTPAPVALTDAAVIAAITRASWRIAGAIILATLVVSTVVVWAAHDVRRALERSLPAAIALPPPMSPAAPSPSVAPAHTAPRPPAAVSPLATVSPLAAAAPVVPSPTVLPAPTVLPSPTVHPSPLATVRPAPLRNPPATPSLAGPTVDELRRARDALRGPVGDCVVGLADPSVRIAAHYAGATGAADRVDLRGVFGDFPIGPCLVRAVRSVRLPRFAAPGFTTEWTFPVPRR